MWNLTPSHLILFLIDEVRPFYLEADMPFHASARCSYFFFLLFLIFYFFFFFFLLSLIYIKKIYFPIHLLSLLPLIPSLLLLPFFYLHYPPPPLHPSCINTTDDHKPQLDFFSFLTFGFHNRKKLLFPFSS